VDVVISFNGAEPELLHS